MDQDVCRFVNMHIMYPMIPSGHLFASTGPLNELAFKLKITWTHEVSSNWTVRAGVGSYPPAPPKVTRLPHLMSCLTPFLHLFCCLLPAMMSTPVCLTSPRRRLRQSGGCREQGSWIMNLSSVGAAQLAKSPNSRWIFTSLQSFPTTRTWRCVALAQRIASAWFKVHQAKYRRPKRCMWRMARCLPGLNSNLRTKGFAALLKVVGAVVSSRTRKRLDTYCHYFCWISVSIRSAEFQLKTNKQTNISKQTWSNDVSSQDDAEKILAHHPICLAIKVT